MGSPRDAALERACAIVARKDVQPLRRALFARKAQRDAAIRAALAVWARLPTREARVAFVSLYGAHAHAQVRWPARDALVLAVHAYRNEERQLRALAALDPRLDVASITLATPRASALARGALAIRRARSVLASYADGDFLVAARVAATAGSFLRMDEALARSTARAVWVSSDGNPYAVALARAAASRGIRTCFVTHGHVAEGPEPLDFDLAILDGEVVREVYARSGPIRGRVVLRGTEGAARPMCVTRLEGGIETLGVLASILVDYARLGDTIRRLRESLRPRRVLLRLHPNLEMRDPHWRRALASPDVVVSDGGRTLEEDLDASDLVVAGNSSVHLGALKRGVPSAYDPRLDDAPDDYYRFVEMGIVPRLASELSPSASCASLRAFFEDPQWAARFARFDAGYLDPEARAREVREALRELVRA